MAVTRPIEITSPAIRTTPKNVLFSSGSTVVGSSVVGSTVVGVSPHAASVIPANANTRSGKIRFLRDIF